MTGSEVTLEEKIRDNLLDRITRVCERSSFSSDETNVDYARDLISSLAPGSSSGKRFYLSELMMKPFMNESDVEIDEFILSTIASKVSSGVDTKFIGRNYQFMRNLSLFDPEKTFYEALTELDVLNVHSTYSGEEKDACSGCGNQLVKGVTYRIKGSDKIEIMGIECFDRLFTDFSPERESIVYEKLEETVKILNEKKKKVDKLNKKYSAYELEQIDRINKLLGELSPRDVEEEMNDEIRNVSDKKGFDKLGVEEKFLIEIGKRYQKIVMYDDPTFGIKFLEPRGADFNWLRKQKGLNEYEAELVNDFLNPLSEMSNGRLIALINLISSRRQVSFENYVGDLLIDLKEYYLDGENFDKDTEGKYSDKGEMKRYLAAIPKLQFANGTINDVREVLEVVPDFRETRKRENEKYILENDVDLTGLVTKLDKLYRNSLLSTQKKDEGTDHSFVESFFEKVNVGTGSPENIDVLIDNCYSLIPISRFSSVIERLTDISESMIEVDENIKSKLEFISSYRKNGIILKNAGLEKYFKSNPEFVSPNALANIEKQSMRLNEIITFSEGKKKGAMSRVPFEPFNDFGLGDVEKGVSLNSSKILGIHKRDNIGKRWMQFMTVEIEPQNSMGMQYRDIASVVYSLTWIKNSKVASQINNEHPGFTTKLDELLSKRKVFELCYEDFNPLLLSSQVESIKDRDDYRVASDVPDVVERAYGEIERLNCILGKKKHHKVIANKNQYFGYVNKGGRYNIVVKDPVTELSSNYFKIGFFSERKASPSIRGLEIGSEEFENKLIRVYLHNLKNPENKMSVFVRPE